MAKKQPVKSIFPLVTKIEEAGIPVQFEELPQGLCGAYDSEGYIVLSTVLSTQMQLNTLVHEFSHALSISVEQYDLCDFEEEVLAFAVEQMIFQKLPAHIAIKSVQKKIEKQYACFPPAIPQVDTEFLEQHVCKVKELLDL